MRLVVSVQHITRLHHAIHPAQFVYKKIRAEKLGITLRMQTRIRQVLGSNIGRNTAYPDTYFVGFLRPSTQITG
jgi:hypothetical protein